MANSSKQQQQQQMRERQERLRREEEAKKKQESRIFLIAMIAVFAIAVIVAAIAILTSIDFNKKKPGPVQTTEAATLAYPNAPKMADLDFSAVEDFSRFEITEEETDYVLINVTYKDNNGISRTGDIVVRLFEEVAPITVKNFKGLVAEKFYDGLVFHRAVEGFMVQGGGYTAAGAHKEPAKTIVGEFKNNGYNNNLQHLRGVISMARTGQPNSASSQFFIMHRDNASLDGNYASFGFTVYGLDVVDAIAIQETNDDEQILETVLINMVRFVKLAPET